MTTTSVTSESVTYTIATQSHHTTAITSPSTTLTSNMSRASLAGFSGSSPQPSMPITNPTIHYAYSTPRIHLPSFNRSDPQLWFIQAEEQMNVANVTEENSKYSILVSALPPEVSCEVRDVLLHRPVVNPYTFLKARIFERLCSTLDERLKRLLQEETLGDRRPTQLLIRMQSLISEGSANIDNAVLRSLFLQRMPPHVREILAISGDETNIERLASMADKIIAANTNRLSVNAINNTSTYDNSPNMYSHGNVQHQMNTSVQQSLPNPLPHNSVQLPSSNSPSLTHHAPNNVHFDPTHYVPNYVHNPAGGHHVNAVSFNAIEQLTKQVSLLTIEVEKLKSFCYSQNNSNRSRPRSRDNNNASSRNRSSTPPSHSNNDTDLCYYHNRYGTKARKCSEGCKFFQQGNDSHLA